MAETLRLDKERFIDPDQAAAAVNEEDLES